MVSSRSTAGLLLVLLVGLGTVGFVGGTTVVDPDSDGVAPVAEIRDGTAVFDADTDGDGLEDGAERRYGTDPTAADTDGDGLDDGTEVYEIGTDPLEEDSDGDGLADGTEVREYGTDPTEADTDGDGLADGDEVREYDTDPLAVDSDDDNLSDFDELEEYGTEPTTADTDGDGLADGPEVLEHETQPTVADTDDDGLADGAEVREYGTDPTDADTDGDGLTDGSEVNRRDIFPEADPLRTDIYVEVDTMERTDLERREAERIASEFEDAPLENPDGSTGADLHVTFDETIPWDSETDVGDLNRIRAQHFDQEGLGYHYLVIVDDVAGDTNTGNVIGKAGLGTMMVESQSGRDQTGSTAMHELGHSLGLSNTDFEGIDTDEYRFSSYSSVMNYNAPRDYYGFSASDGSSDFDDWGYLDDHMFTPATSFVGSDD
ncbi:zinc metalloprotease [Natrinema versiforme]|uniref:Thrombospondin type 3 repeat-containing protein n=1 Tax=Natrinema versiforme JCM 10478 TaxID=1227496 RepID=L9Y147_9EURY|nr:hypothetical protein [Natrinema versiforme]ELY67819.1 hypothetical protein C489_09671 [Natrinema versiforme JCM 10478]